MLMGQGDIHHRLIPLMSEQLPYLEKELTLVFLSDILNAPTNHLSQVINSVKGKNFLAISTDIG